MRTRVVMEMALERLFALSFLLHRSRPDPLCAFNHRLCLTLLLGPLPVESV